MRLQRAALRGLASGLGSTFDYRSNTMTASTHTSTPEMRPAKKTSGTIGIGSPRVGHHPTVHRVV